MENEGQRANPEIKNNSTEHVGTYYTVNQLQLMVLQRIRNNNSSMNKNIYTTLKRGIYENTRTRCA